MQSSNRWPIANLGEDQLLSCFLPTDGEGATLKGVSVTWQKTELAALVYQYKDGAAELADQSPQFRGRTQLFTDDLTKGNTSLLLRDVTGSDDGEYTCTVSSSDGGGTVNIHLRTAGRKTCPPSSTAATQPSELYHLPSVPLPQFTLTDATVTRLFMTRGSKIPSVT